MTESKHTSGPWWVTDGQSIHAGQGEDRLIAHCHAGHKDERLANARLIAAAPDLLLACQAIARMTVTKTTNHAEVLAICMAIAETEVARATE